MPLCDELKNDFESIKNLKLELDLEFQKEKGERDYSRVQVIKEKIEKERDAFQDKRDPIPKSLRGKEGVRTEKLEIGGKTKDQLIQELKENKFKISEYARDILNSDNFTVSLKPESISIIHLRVGDLGFSENQDPPIAEIYRRIAGLGLEICPAEVGLNYALKHPDESITRGIIVGMKPIADHEGTLRVFGVGKFTGRCLDGWWARPESSWGSSEKVVFRARYFRDKSKTESK